MMLHGEVNCCLSYFVWYFIKQFLLFVKHSPTVHLAHFTRVCAVLHCLQICGFSEYSGK